MSLNKVLLVGNLGGDPELRTTTNGQSVASFTIATNRRWTNKETGKPQEETEWHRIVVWGRQGENCKEYLHKGRQVLIEGRLQTRQWDDKEGNKRYTTEIVAQNVQFLGGGNRADAAPAEQPSFESEAPSSPGGPAAASPAAGGDDDIPF